MNVEDLRKKVAAAEEKVKKCMKTIERHKAQMEKEGQKLREMGIDPETADKYEFVKNGTEWNQEAYWLLCDYESKKDDIHGAEGKLADALRVLSGWQEKLDIAINEEMVIQEQVPQVIKDFLEALNNRTYFNGCGSAIFFVNLKSECSSVLLRYILVIS